MIRLPFPCLVVLGGPSGAGKSTWAGKHFRPEQVVSSDHMRALVGEHEQDQRAGADAFEVFDLVLERRLRRGLLTVVDSLALESKRRSGYLALARRHGVAAHLVAFDTPDSACRERNRARAVPVPERALASQLRAWKEARAAIEQEGWDGVHAPGPVSVVPTGFADAPQWAALQEERPLPLRFGLQISSFSGLGGPASTAERLSAIARAAEEAGFSSLWVMDHFLQIPQVGREWEDMLDSYTTLGFLARATSTIRLGTLVTGITYRNPAHLAKIVATLDVLSGGRAACGLGAAWFAREHQMYGWAFPPVGERFELLEDALQLLPLMWGKGTPSFEGRRLSIPAAICYPRPLQDHIPILVGGSGERRTLRLVARYADACNLFGDPDTVRHKLGVLHRHCQELGRDPASVEVTHLSPCLTARTAEELSRLVDRLRGPASPEAYGARVNAAVVADQVGRFRALAAAGVETAIVSMPDLNGPESIERFAEVVAAFSPAAAG